MSREASDKDSRDLDESRRRIVRLIHNAMRNYPPIRSDTYEILSEIKKIFPDLEVLRAQTSAFEQMSQKERGFWWDMVHLTELLHTIDKRMKKKPLSPERQKEAFAFVLWLTYDLLFKDYYLQSQKIGENEESKGDTFVPGEIQPDYLIRSELIITSIMNINALFGRIGRTDSVLLKEDVPMFFAKLPVRCRNSVDDFSVRLQSLADLFEVNLDALRSLAGEKSQEFKLVKLTEFWLKKEKVPNYAQVTNVWRNIVFLRQMPPTHSDIRPQALNAVQFFGQKLPVDYSELWETILNEFSESLIELQKILSDLCLG